MKSLIAVLCIAAVFTYTHAATLGQACTNTTMCSYANSNCDLATYSPYGCTQGMCDCATGFAASGSDCKAEKNVGVACNSTTDVCVTGSTCNATSGNCECLTDYTAVSGNTACEKKAHGATCTADAECATTNCSTTCACLADQTFTTQDVYLTPGSCLASTRVTGVAVDGTCSLTSSPPKICADGNRCIKCPESSTDGACKADLSATATTAAASGNSQNSAVIPTITLTNLGLACAWVYLVS